jgi:hypothetical protein
MDTVTKTETYQPPVVVMTETATVTAAINNVGRKREALPNQRAIPVALAVFASSRISSACRCIVTPSTRIVTATQTQNVPGPQVTQTLDGEMVTLTVTTIISVTSEQTTTVTLSPSTTTQTLITTVTPTPVKPKICSARGLPGPNAFNYSANFNTDQAACIASCKSDPRCLSTGFYIATNPSTGTQTGTCRYYDKSVTDSANLGSGYYTFNDKAC